MFTTLSLSLHFSSDIDVDPEEAANLFRNARGVRETSSSLSDLLNYSAQLNIMQIFIIFWTVFFPNVFKDLS